jgi:hypothetical protein
MIDPVRVWSRVAMTEDGCWLWCGARSKNGYGAIWLRGTQTTAHRIAYALAKGPIPDGAEIDHLCSNKGCVRPSHLEAVTHSENCRRSRVLRGVQRKRRYATRDTERAAKQAAFPTGVCFRGHDLSQTTHVRPDGRGRYCRECKKIQMKNWHSKQR